MSNYEAAPATKMLAQHCCVCGRPLLDADSVTAGMGPDCRAKYGEPVVESDIKAATELVAKKFGTGELAQQLMSLILAGNQRATANKLVHFIASGQSSKDEQGNAVAVLYVLGYTKLAVIVAKRLFTAYVFPQPDGNYRVLTKYDYEFAGAAYRAGFRFHKEGGRHDKHYVVPANRRRDLFDLLVRHFRGETAVSHQGAFTVEPRRG